jgi:hypothetical protein
VSNLLRLTQNASFDELIPIGVDELIPMDVSDLFSRVPFWTQICSFSVINASIAVCSRCSVALTNAMILHYPTLPYASLSYSTLL